jgi:hypothetical protein
MAASDLHILKINYYISNTPQERYLHRQYQSKSSHPQTQRNKYIDSGNAQIARRHKNGDIVSGAAQAPKNPWTSPN